MALFSQSPFLPAHLRRPAKGGVFASKNFRIAFSLSPANENLQEFEPTSGVESVKLAFSKAAAYKKSMDSNPEIPASRQDSLAEVGVGNCRAKSDDLNSGSENKEVPLAVKLALEKAKEYKKSRDAESSKDADSKNFRVSAEESSETDEKKRNLDNGDYKDASLAVKLALEKAKEYKNNKSVEGSSKGSEKPDSGLQGGNVQNPGVNRLTKSSNKEALSISSIDFMGLSFSDKKSGRGLPAGLVPISDPFPEVDLPEVEILVGDSSKFSDGVAESKPMPVLEDDVDVYKPKVSTWGVFPRPSNISKTYGGGRTIRPGEPLEAEDIRAAKEARTRQLLAAYKRKTGRNIDPKLKADCEKALNDGDSLMHLGKLKEALPFYEGVVEKLPFQSELHGLAALQWSICQDSLNMSDEARMMYEKLQSHPSPPVSKKARQLLFSFQAMEMMKVSGSNVSSPDTGYQDYFEALLKDKTNYQPLSIETDEGSLAAQALPYIIFLLSPILIVSLLAAFKP